MALVQAFTLCPKGSALVWNVLKSVGMYMCWVTASGCILEPKDVKPFTPLVRACSPNSFPRARRIPSLSQQALETPWTRWEQFRCQSIGGWGIFFSRLRAMCRQSLVRLCVASVLFGTIQPDQDGVAASSQSEALVSCLSHGEILRMNSNLTAREKAAIPAICMPADAVGKARQFKANAERGIPGGISCKVTKWYTASLAFLKALETTGRIECASSGKIASIWKLNTLQR